MWPAPKLYSTKHQSAPHTTFAHLYNADTLTKYKVTKYKLTISLSTHPLLFHQHTPRITFENNPSLSPLADSLQLGSSASNARNFFFGGFSRYASSRSPSEGVDTWRDGAINANAGRVAQATHGARAPSCPIRMFQVLPADLLELSTKLYYFCISSFRPLIPLLCPYFTRSGFSTHTAADVVVDKGSEYILSQGVRRAPPGGGVGRGNDSR